MRRNTSTNSKKGFSLVELCIVLAILAVLAGSITPVYIKRIQVKAGEKTSLEMSVIQQAALSYYLENNAWPDNLTALQTAGYLNPSWVTNNPWQNPYAIYSSLGSFTVSTIVPQEWTGLVARDLPTSSISGTSVNSSVPAPGSMLDSSLPAGAIIIWSGSIASIPDGWQLCDGTNGTPDLRDKFIVGARVDDAGTAKTNITGALTKYGGSISHNHTFSAIAQANSDHHAVRNDYQNVGVARNDHTHRVSGTTDSTVNLPPYYALAYIMKI